MITTIRNVLRTPDLRNKILFTLFIIGVYRLGAQIPAPGVDLDQLVQLRDNQDATSGGIFGYLNLLSGGGIANLSFFSLGILPYITSSIIIQILTVAIPKLEEWQSQGAVGQRKITQWTRYIAVILALVQSTGIVFLVNRNPEQFFGAGSGVDIFPNGGAARIFLAVMCITVGTAVVMWLGELITQKGIGNGMSMIIFASVTAALPALGIQLWERGKVSSITQFGVLGIALLLLAFLVVGIVFVEQGQRRIPVNFPKRQVGRRVMGGNNTYIPLKVNQAGVIPVIFASSLLQLPSLVVNVLPTSGDPANGNWGDAVRNFVSNNLYQPTNLGYILVFGFLIIGFAYFYNSIAFDPIRRADELKKQGGFIPGIRPGSQTEAHMAKILNRITLPGAVFLGLVALVPSAILAWYLGGGGNVGLIGFSGVSILIGVGVSLELLKQIDSQLMQRNYEGFLK
ncbi:MAG: preprotein translocase subunit SecY [Acidimicrobiales bacterium]|nr:preprotein translocase subunit SecY [Acidimicrobiales bacterium]